MRSAVGVPAWATALSPFDIAEFADAQPLCSPNPMASVGS